VWVTNDDAALAAARDEFLRQQAEKERRAAERAAKEAAAKKKKAAVERDVFIPDTISVAQLAEKFGIKAVWLMRKMKGIGMEDIQCRPGYSE
jgi:FMN phosphatase YigB (HAD superfamily)